MKITTDDIRRINKKLDLFDVIGLVLVGMIIGGSYSIMGFCQKVVEEVVELCL